MPAALTNQGSLQPKNQYLAGLGTASARYPDLVLVDKIPFARSAAKNAVEFTSPDGGKTVSPFVQVGEVRVRTTLDSIPVAEGVPRNIGTGLIPLQNWSTHLLDTGHNATLIAAVRKMLESRPLQFCYLNEKRITTVAGASHEISLAVLLSTSSELNAWLSETNALGRRLTEQDYEFVESLTSQLEGIVEEYLPQKIKLQAYPDGQYNTAAFLNMVRSVAQLASDVTTQPENPILQEALKALQSWPESALVKQLQGSLGHRSLSN